MGHRFFLQFLLTTVLGIVIVLSLFSANVRTAEVHGGSRDSSWQVQKTYPVYRNTVLEVSVRLNFSAAFQVSLTDIHQNWTLLLSQNLTALGRFKQYSYTVDVRDAGLLTLSFMNLESGSLLRVFEVSYSIRVTYDPLDVAGRLSFLLPTFLLVPLLVEAVFLLPSRLLSPRALAFFRYELGRDMPPHLVTAGHLVVLFTAFSFDFVYISPGRQDLSLIFSWGLKYLPGVVTGVAILVGLWFLPPSFPDVRYIWTLPAGRERHFASMLFLVVWRVLLLVLETTFIYCVAVLWLNLGISSGYFSVLVRALELSLVLLLESLLFLLLLNWSGRVEVSVILLVGVLSALDIAAGDTPLPTVGFTVKHGMPPLVLLQATFLAVALVLTSQYLYTNREVAP